MTLSQLAGIEKEAPMRADERVQTQSHVPGRNNGAHEMMKRLSSTAPRR